MNHIASRFLDALPRINRLLPAARPRRYATFGSLLSWLLLVQCLAVWSQEATVESPSGNSDAVSTGAETPRTGAEAAPLIASPSTRAAMEIAAEVREEIALQIASDQSGFAEAWYAAEADRLNLQNGQGPQGAALLRELEKVSPAIRVQLLTWLNLASQRLLPIWREAKLDSPPPSDLPAEGIEALPENRHPLDATIEQWGKVRAALAQQRAALLGEAAAMAADQQWTRGIWGTISRWFFPTLLLALFWFMACFARLPWLRRHYARREMFWVFAELSFGMACSIGLLLAVEWRCVRTPPAQTPALEALPDVPLTASQLQELQRTSLRARQRLEIAERNYQEQWREWQATVVGQLPETREWLSTWALLRAAAREAAIQTSTLEQVETYIQRDSSEHTRLANLQAGLATQSRWVPYASLVVAAHWGLFVLLAIVRFRARLAPRLFGVCPRCYTPRQLRPLKEGDEYVYECQADGFSKKGKCGFRMKRRELSLRKLHFPTVGLPSTGKTIWLLGMYNAMFGRSAYDANTLNFSETECAARAEIQELIHMVMTDSQGLAAVMATTEAPSPLVIHFYRNLCTASELLMHVFDYGGEVTQSFTMSDPLRRRQMKADGLLLFLDPTKSEDEIERQVRAIDKVLADAGSAAARMPVAVCVTKMDMIQKIIPGDARDRLRREYGNFLATHDPKSLSWDDIEARSAAVKAYLQELWPDRLEATIRKLGADYKFFPLSAGGTRRPPGPGPLMPEFVLAPLLWLLTLNGFPALESLRRPPATPQLTPPAN